MLAILLIIAASHPRSAADPAPVAPEATGHEWSAWGSVLPDRPRTPAATPDLPRLAGDPDAARAGTAAPETAKPLRGLATWYCGSRCTRGHPGGLYAAAGSELRTPGWRGSRVTVTASNGRRVTVTLIDACACKGERIIDLYADAFRRLAPLSRGVIAVRVLPAVRLPATDR